MPRRPRITPNSAAIVRNTLRAPALRYRDFRLLVAASFFDSIGFMGEQVIVGWLVLEITDDPFMVGVALGLRFAPFFFLGLVAGTIADMVDRRSLIRVLNLAMTAVMCCVGALIYYDTLEVWHIFAFAVLGGCISALHQTSRQSFAFDVVGRQNLVSGLAYVSLGMRLGGLVGSLAAGYLIAGYGANLVRWLRESLIEAALSQNWLMEAVGLDRLLNAALNWDWFNSVLEWLAAALSQGAASAYFLLAAGYLVSVAMLSFIRSRGQAAPTQRRSALQNLREFAGELRLNNALLMLMVIVAATEVLGFSSATAFPSLARDVLNVGADGLGEMNAFRSVGAVLSILLLSAYAGEVGRKGALLLATIVAFGGGAGTAGTVRHVRRRACGDNGDRRRNGAIRCVLAKPNAKHRAKRTARAGDGRLGSGHRHSAAGQPSGGRSGSRLRRGDSADRQRHSASRHSRRHSATVHADAAVVITSPKSLPPLCAPTPLR